MSLRREFTFQAFSVSWSPGPRCDRHHGDGCGGQDHDDHRLNDNLSHPDHLGEAASVGLPAVVQQVGLPVVQVVVRGELDLATGPELVRAGHQLCREHFCEHCRQRDLQHGFLRGVEHGVECGVKCGAGESGQRTAPAGTWLCRVDVTQMPFMDVAGLHAFWQLNTVVRAAGGRMRVVGLRPSPLLLVQAMEVDESCELGSMTGAFLAAFSRGQLS